MKQITAVKPSNSGTLTSYAVMHALIDGVCAAGICGTIKLHTETEELFKLIVIYNIIAFAGQALFGLFFDHTSQTHMGVRLSILLVAAGFMFPIKYLTMVKVVLMALGNGIFHTAAGTSVLRRSSFKATPLGIFVAPGALGLAIGTLMPFFGVFMLVLLMFIGSGKDTGVELENTLAPNPLPSIKPGIAVPLLVLMLLFVVFSRSFVGSAATFEWKSGIKPILIAGAAVTAGKALGGIVYDRIGAVWMCFFTLPSAAALLIFCHESMILSLIALMLLNMTMPVTLLLLYRVMPRYPGLSFGLAAAVLYPGHIISKLIPSDGSLLIPAICGVLGLNLVYIIICELFIKNKSKNPYTDR